MFTEYVFGKFVFTILNWNVSSRIQRTGRVQKKQIVLTFIRDGDPNPQTHEKYFSSMRRGALAQSHVCRNINAA